MKSPPMSVAQLFKSPFKMSNSMDSNRLRKQVKPVLENLRLRAFQNLPIKGQMKIHRLPHCRKSSLYNQSNQKSCNKRYDITQQPKQEALRLLKDNDNMFEKYLRKPQTTSVGFLVISKL